MPEHHTQDSYAIVALNEIALEVEMAKLFLVATYMAMKDTSVVEVDLVIAIKKNSYLLSN